MRLVRSSFDHEDQIMCPDLCSIFNTVSTFYGFFEYPVFLLVPKSHSHNAGSCDGRVEQPTIGA